MNVVGGAGTPEPIPRPAEPEPDEPGTRPGMPDGIRLMPGIELVVVDVDELADAAIGTLELPCV